LNYNDRVSLQKVFSDVTNLLSNLRTHIRNCRIQSTNYILKVNYMECI